MKALLVFVFCLLSPTLMSGTINLDCEVTAKSRTANVTADQERGRATIEIDEIGDDLFLKIRSEISIIDNFTIDTLVFDDPTKMSAGENLSTDEKWEVTQSSGRKKGGKIETVTERRFFVDRRSGLMVLSIEFTVSGGQLLVDASGRCQKASSERAF